MLRTTQYTSYGAVGTKKLATQAPSGIGRPVS